MKALVVYDSVFGNTEKIAQAIGQAIGGQTLRATDASADRLTGVECLVVGSPTRAMQPTKAVKRFLKSLPPRGLVGMRTAAFDTRADMSKIHSKMLHFVVRLFGYAADPIAARLERKGGLRAASPEGFIVDGTEGPLRQGELERAGDWARKVAAG